MNMKRSAALLREHFPSACFSPVFKTKAMEAEDQDDFLNAVCGIETAEEPREVLNRLQNIERLLKKSPAYRYGPRTIDLDLLLYGREIIDIPHLKVPHDRMQERRFVLEPLMAFVDAEDTHPAYTETWNNLLKKTLNQGCKRIDLIL